MTSPEQITLDRAKQFDLDTLAAIYDRYSPGIFRYALRLTGDAVHAEECTAETFSRFLTALKNGGGPTDHLQAYLYRIAHNWITDFYRREPVHEALNENLHEEKLGTAETTEEQIARNEVRMALKCLTPDQRQVVVLKYIEGWENEDIARTLQKKVNAIKALQHRAIEALQRVLLAKEKDG